MSPRALFGHKVHWLKSLDYNRYAESIPDAAAAFAPAPPSIVTVAWTDDANAQLAATPSQHLDFRVLAEQVLQQDPRPTWQQRTQKQPDKIFFLHLADMRVSWRHDVDPANSNATITVLGCEPLVGDDIPSLFVDRPQARRADLVEDNDAGALAKNKEQPE